MRVKTLHKDEAPGKLLRFATESGAGLTDSQGHTIALAADELVRIIVERSGGSPPAEAFVFELSGGDQVYGQVEAGGETSFQIAGGPWGPITLPLGRLASITTPAGRRQSGGATSRPTTQPDTDAVRLVNGDRISCLVTGIGPAGVSITSDAGQESTIAYDVLASVVLAQASAERTSAPKSERQGVIVWTADGSRLTFASLDWDARQARGTLPGGAALQTDGGQIRRVEMVSGRFDWLSNMRPMRTESSAHWGPQWTPLADRNVLGGPIIVAGRRYYRGWGVHSRSRLAFDLGGRFVRFRCTAGLDDEAGPLADCDVRLVADGREVFARKSVRKDSGELAIDVDISGCKVLELVVDFGANGDVQDRFDWADPLLIGRRPPAGR